MVPGFEVLVKSSSPATVRVTRQVYMPLSSVALVLAASTLYDDVVPLVT